MSWVLAALSPTAAFADRSAPKEAVPLAAKLVAQRFFGGIVAGRQDAVIPLLADRVRAEGRWLEVAERPSALAAMIERGRYLKLRRVTLISLQEMVRRYGPPPARLRPAIRRGDLVALARFSVLGAIAGLRRDNNGHYKIWWMTD